MKYPVTLILPTRNCLKDLERHLGILENELSNFAQVIAVDSESTDGTFELLRDCLVGNPNTSLFSFRPGLYESWNFAIEQCACDFIYFSTVGDIFDSKRFPDLLNAAAELKCDILVSPPRMMEADGVTPSAMKWPIHWFTDSNRIEHPQLLSREETILGLYSFITGSLMGSSASNLYRAGFLKTHPFPENFGHAGDTAWGLRYGPEVRMGIFPDNVATFTLGWQFRDHDARKQRDTFLRLSEEGKNALHRANERGENLEYMRGWFDAMTDSKDNLWKWLASQAELATQHHALIGEMNKMEMEMKQRLPGRIINALRRRLRGFTSS